ncbi:MBL fold metallo-hydrolase [Amycolatopsis sp. NPDC051373]|uniref:MBL fold metallo-hydrolase n=1 Tax=Amycolatopsis sp. NPDC051373 TaxID=3155801 RepID=UPI00344B359F
MTTKSETSEPTSRRAVLKTVAAAAVVPAATGLLGATMPSSASASESGTLPDFAPVPSASAGPALNANGYYVGRIEGNLYWVTDSFYQAMFLTTSEGVVLVDAPPTIGHNLLRAIDDVTKANGMPNKVTHLIYSHSHADHIGASAILGSDVVRIGHAETRRLLRTAGDPNRPVPTETFDDRYVLNVGVERLELTYHGPNHSPDNIFIHAPGHQTLMVVDVIFPGWVPFKSLAVSQDIPAWVKAHDIAMGYPWKTLVGGHLGRLGARSDGYLQKQYLADLDAAVRDASETVDPAPYFQKYGASGNAWAIFKTYLDAVSRRAAEPVIAKYTGTLAAADVFTVDNAFAMLESHRIDKDLLGPFGVHP